MNDREPPRSLGRGAGVNKPAWMVAQEREGGGGPTGIPGEDRFPNGGGDGRGGGGDDRDPHGGGSGGGPGRSSPERDQFGRVRDVGRGGDYGGGGGGYRGDERGDRRDGDERHGRRDDFHDGPRGGGGGGRRRDDWRGGGGGRRDDRRGGRDRRGGGNRSGIYFHSYEEERAWLEERRRKRRARKSLFDVEPTPEQAAMDEARAALERDHLLRTGAVYGGILPGVVASSSAGSRMLQPQQTRHARRLYVGNIPDLSEDQVHDFFRDAIRTAVVVDPATNPNADNHRSQYVENDPLLSVYINRDRRFAFLEFKTMEICTACLAFDGIDILGRGKVKIKRPNDYNPSLAPATNAAALPQLDISKLGIVSPSVPDGPNKIFIGGLPYHLTEAQVLELLQAFGTVKAFHLVKTDPTAVTSKGYCFVEYSDPSITQIAVMGLNGMEMGEEKQLSARIASSKDDPTGGALGAPVAVGAVSGAGTVVDGVDVDALLQAALGGAGGAPAATAGAGMGPMGSMMMMQQQQLQQQRQPAAAAMGGMAQYGMNPMASVMQQPQQSQVVVTDPLAVANAAATALGAAFGGVPAASGPGSVLLQQKGQPQAPSSVPSTRILVLLNMVMDEDLATDEEYKMLFEEVQEEARKYGKLISIKIPRPQDGHAPSAVKKIFLEYATNSDAEIAKKALEGRAFGPSVVEASYFSEENYSRNQLS
eukprot:CAMPEP_0171400150 /NCGR_PEP_ID=MMETSP0880-20121228/7085_1 /TAXON_ID=67004 /ORGANISM="Thalassiosira weissflogii, Strain CCMP1336" /LENGTH=704 /DNA_ID=CAMNT_0011914433 /DNA_START=6 /DNA_END=2120 /DNA_ORIENTATION=+